MPSISTPVSVSSSNCRKLLKVPAKLLPPDLVTTLIAAPVMLPYSAEAPMPSTWISPMVSGLMYHQARPVSGPVTFSPSTLQLFELVLEPYAESWLLNSVPPLIPGVTATMSQKLLRVGMSSMNSAAKLVGDSELRRSMRGTSPVTRISSVTAPLSVNSSDT